MGPESSPGSPQRAAGGGRAAEGRGGRQDARRRPPGAGSQDLRVPEDASPSPRGLPAPDPKDWPGPLLSGPL